MLDEQNCLRIRCCENLIILLDISHAKRYHKCGINIYGSNIRSGLTNKHSSSKMFETSEQLKSISIGFIAVGSEQGDLL